jgi:hypothetical protein
MHVAGDVTFFRNKHTNQFHETEKISFFILMKQEKTNQEKTSARQKNPPIIHLKKRRNPTQKEQCVQRPHKDKKH